MTILYYGGQKSGKSRLAETKALELAHGNKPYYVATYDNSYGDSEMHARIARHRKQRGEKFHTLEAPLYLADAVRDSGVYLIDCISMWLLNTLTWDEARLFEELDALFAKKATLIMVLNDISRGIIPLEAMSRAYIDRSGIVGQYIARHCEEVYEVTLGIAKRLK